MRVVRMLLCAASLVLLVSCVKQERDLPTISHADFIEAHQTEDTPAPLVREVVKPLPLPGQLKRRPTQADQERTTACPICLARGKSVKQANKKHTHRSGAVIEFANKAARQRPKLDDYFNSVQVYDYSPGALYQIYTAPLFETAIILQPGEALQSASAGDTKRWVFLQVHTGTGDNRQPIFLIKPHASGFTTNLILTTNLRTYLLELTAYKKTYMAAVSWHYPNTTFKALYAKRQQETREKQQVIAPQVNIDSLNFSYVIVAEDHIRWKPVRVFDDGSKTYIQFPRTLPTSEAPALFIIAEGRKTQLVNYRVRANYYIVDRLFTVAELRVGLKKPRVVRIIRRTR